MPRAKEEVLSQVIAQRQLSQRLAKDHYFRQLTGHEEEAVSVIDNRDLTQSNNKLLLICERASNDLKGTQTDYKEKSFLLGHDAFDPGAADLSNYISERTKCIALHTNFSRLLIDPSKPIASDQLVPLQYIDGSFVSFNKDGFDLQDRLSNFYLIYHKVLSEMIWFLNPQYVILIKSHFG